MTPEEKAFCEEIRRSALDLIGWSGLIEQDAQHGSRTAERARKLSVGLLNLARLSAQRVAKAEIGAEAVAVAAADYDLSALITAAPSSIEE